MLRVRQDQAFGTEHLLADLKGHSVRSGAITISSHAVKFVLQIGSTLILARLLTPSDFGLVAMVTVFTGFVSLFKDLGLSVSTVQRERISHEQVSTLFWINVGLSMVLMLVAAITAPAVARFYEEPRLTLIMLAIAGTFILGGLTAQHSALLQRQMRFGRLAVVEIGSAAVGIAVGVIMALGGAGYWSLVAMTATNVAVTMVLTWIFSGWRPGLPRRRAGVAPMVAFGGNLSAAQALNYVGANLDSVLIGWWWGSGALGIYSKAYQLLTLPLTQLNAPVAAVALPAMSRALTHPSRYRHAYLSLGRQLALATGPPIAVMIVCSDWLVDIVLGSQWRQTARLFSILGFAAFLLPIWNSTGWLFLSQDRTREHLHFHMIDSIAKVASVLAGLPWGPAGVAIGVAVRYYAMLPVLFWLVGRRGPVSTRDLFGMLMLPGVVSLTCLAAVSGLKALAAPMPALPGLLVAGVVAAGAAALVLLVVPSGRAAARESAASFNLLFRRYQRIASDSIPAKD